MKIKIFSRLISAAMVLCLNFGLAKAQVTPRWLQQPVISPDGMWIVFEYQGKIWKVPVSGGAAVQLTGGNGYSGFPVWSHDSKTIAYANERYGNFDVFVIDADGGAAKRLTSNSQRDIPQDFSSDDSSVIFTSARHDIYTSARFPSSNNFLNLYQVHINGGRSILISSAGMDKAKLDKNGKELIFQDYKGGENPLRKHHTSSVTRDIWTYNLVSKHYKKVSSFHGDDLNPVWGEGEDIYYLSERSGSLNVYKGNVSDSSKVIQLTTFKDNPVRNLSISFTGVLSFTYNGDLYTLKYGAVPEKVVVKIQSTPVKTLLEPFFVKGEISEMNLSPDGRQIAFISHGDLFVTSANGATTTRLTSTPYQERMPQFSPDGKRLLYSVERESWDIEQFRMISPKGAFFDNKSKLIREGLITTQKDEFQGVFSPDGEQIAYVEERDILRTYNVENKKTQLLLPEGINYSSVDGDQYFKWSPDSQSLLIHSKEGTTGYDNEVLLVKNDGSGNYVNLSKSGFKDDKPQWNKSGKMVYWLSDKDAYRNFTEDSQKGVYAMYFDTKPALNKQGEWERKKLTDFSGDIAECLISPEEKRLFFLGKGEQGYDLYTVDLTASSSKLLVKLNMRNPKMEMTKDGQSIFILNDGNIIRISPDRAKTLPLEISAKVEVDLLAERAYIFDHMYKLLKKRFMYPDLTAAAIEKNYLNYKQFVPYISNDLDFSILVNEFLGELNTSHTGAWGRISHADSDETAALGLLYDQSRTGKGLLVKEVISSGPFDLTGSHMKPNMIIDKINGIDITEGIDWSSALNHQAGKPTKIVFRDSISGNTFEESVTPLSIFDENEYLLYNRWIRRMEFLTDSLSGGKIGYVHVRVMNDAGMRNLYDKTLGRYRNAQALVVDTRFNRGGSLHDELTTFLNGKIYLTENRQNRITPSGEPFKKWNKPSVMLISEGNYSDAYLTPYAYRLMGIGKLVGMPVPGTGTASQGEQQINKNIGFYFATAATYFQGNTHANENFQLEPDIRIANDYEKILNGNDQQLQRAVEEMLLTIKR